MAEPKEALIEFEYKYHINDNYCGWNDNKPREPYVSDEKIVQVFVCCDFLKERTEGRQRAGEGFFNIAVSANGTPAFNLHGHSSWSDNSDDDEVYFPVKFCPGCGARIKLLCVKKTVVTHNRATKQVRKIITEDQCVDEPVETVEINLLGNPQ